MQRTALVTGGMGGLGEPICMRLAATGCRVIATYSPSNNGAAEWLQKMQDQQCDITGIFCDVADYDSCHHCCDNIYKDFGSVDILINNAGITRDKTFRKMTKSEWDAVLHTNLDSVFNMTKQVVEGMVERHWGRVVNISSLSAQKGAFGQTNYAATKAAIHGFTKALAIELAKNGVTVNTVSPGYIGTKMVQAIPEAIMQEKILTQIPLGRVGEPAEVAGLVAYLVSD
jgi:acetoacetyl-CoA reductase